VSAASPEAALPLVGVTVVLDPGHNGRNAEFPDEINRIVDVGNGTRACNTTGTTTDDGYPEARFNWEVAQLAVMRLEALGAEAVLTRTDNDGWGPCITERAATGNRARADAVVSIHADGGPADGRGFHLIFPASIPALTDDIAEESRLLAETLRAACLATGMPISTYAGVDGLSERDDLGGLNLSNVPAVFLEVGNMRNATDAALLTDPGFQARIAEAIVTGISAFLVPID
jgi:N-acetylmuramoyl-L-alanine amidase